jgi:O-antigen/teichoic acid export membrane protein
VFTLTSALFLHLLTILVFITIIGFRLKPVFRRIRQVFKALWEENKTYGFPVYVGAITSIASTQIAGFTISYFIDNTNVGYFYLAVTAAMPLSLIPSTAGTTFFKDFVHMDKIPRTVFLITLMITLLALTGFLMIIKPVVLFLYTEEYISVVSLAYYTAIAATFQGLGDFFNRFISAHGYGNKLRNSSFIIAAFNILGYTLIVFKMGVEGAVITRLLASMVYFGLMWRIYTKTRENG